eukprot:15351387-Ditylum_brightwellii.AAC.2
MIINKTAHTQVEITTVTAKAAAMPTTIFTVIDMTITMTREAKEATVMMTSKEGIAIVMAVKASHSMWRKSIVALALDPRAAVAVTFQVAATL